MFRFFSLAVLVAFSLVSARPTNSSCEKCDGDAAPLLQAEEMFNFKEELLPDLSGFQNRLVMMSTSWSQISSNLVVVFRSISLLIQYTRGAAG